MAIDVISAPQAADLAGITYRQLDHWARKGWVVPSISEGQGRSGRRLYSLEDVVRLQFLAHLGRSKRNLTALGSVVAKADLDGEFAVVGSAGEVHTVDGLEELKRAVTTTGEFTVFDLGTARRGLSGADAPEAIQNSQPDRRTA